MSLRPALLTLSLLVPLAACDLEATIRREPGDRTSDRVVQQELPDVDIQQDESPTAPSAVTDVVEEVLPSVVNVRVKNVGENPFTGEFEEGQGQGSGVVIDPGGVIVTNNHVIAGAVEVTVAFNDGRRPLEGEVIGAIPENDLAVIRVEADDLDAIEIGRSDNLRLGESVVAIGFPLGLGGPTVTQGIISGLERTIRVDDAAGESQSLEGLLQTDAAINPGNSGGALVDLAGRLVGINTAAAQASTAENIGFAIAIDEAVPVVEEIIEDPPEERAWIGVSLGSVDDATAASQVGLDEDARGALVLGVVPGSPADEAGLEEGALITRIDDDDIRSADDVTTALRDRAPGDRVEVTYVTLDGDEGSVDLELGSRPQVFERRG